MRLFPLGRPPFPRCAAACLVAVLLGCSLFPTGAAAQADGPEEGDTRRLLFLTHAALYRHPSLPLAEQTVTELGERGGFEVTTHEGYRYTADEMDLSFLTAEYLAGFDGLMLFTNGNLPLTGEQKEAILEFVRRGGGLVGVHSATLTLYDTPEFGEMLGGYFRRPIQQGHLFVLRVEDEEHPATRMLGPSWPIVDELYHFGTEAWDPERPDENRDELFGHPIPLAFSRDRVNVLLSIDTERSDLEGLPGLEEGGDYPQAWYRTYGEGRSFYTSLGHTDEIWTSDRVFRAHVLGGIRWVLGLED